MNPLNPTDDYELYDSFLLAGEPSPGICRFGAPKAVTGWNNAAGKGDDGGETTLNGAVLSEFTCTITLWNGDYELSHFILWEAWKPILMTPVAKGAERALDIYHPQLADLGITSVVVKSWTNPEPNPDGTSTVTIEFLQYSPAKPRPNSSGKMQGSAANPQQTPSGGKKPGQIHNNGGAAADPNAKLREELERKQAEYDAL